MAFLCVHGSPFVCLVGCYFFFFFSRHFHLSLFKFVFLHFNLFVEQLIFKPVAYIHIHMIRWCWCIYGPHFFWAQNLLRNIFLLCCVTFIFLFNHVLYKIRLVCIRNVNIPSNIFHFIENLFLLVNKSQWIHNNEERKQRIRYCKLYFIAETWLNYESKYFEI